MKPLWCIVVGFGGAGGVTLHVRPPTIERYVIVPTKKRCRSGGKNLNTLGVDPRLLEKRVNRLPCPHLTLPPPRPNAELRENNGKHKGRLRSAARRPPPSRMQGHRCLSTLAPAASGWADGPKTGPGLAPDTLCNDSCCGRSPRTRGTRPRAWGAPPGEKSVPWRFRLIPKKWCLAGGFAI